MRNVHRLFSMNFHILHGVNRDVSTSYSPCLESKHVHCSLSPSSNKLHEFPVKSVWYKITLTPWLHTRLYNFARNISTNISTLGERTNLKLGQLSSLFIVYNITISWLNPLRGFWSYLLLRDNPHSIPTSLTRTWVTQFASSLRYKVCYWALILVRFSRFHMEIQRDENNSSNSGTDNVNGRNPTHSDRSASNRLPFL